ncbi:MAG: endonuclease V, partial [Desulfurococcales archaeon]|nr:endonuclease V [Desulfurococcales archaeon]
MIDPCRAVRERFSVARAERAQRLMSSMLSLEDSYGPVRVVAGLDVAYKRYEGGEIGVGVAVALSYPGFRVLKCYAAVRLVCVPYIPGLLAFREMAVLSPAFKSLLLESRPDLVLVDGHGLSHPRGFGIASHVGVAFGVPSIGVAKKRLYGRERRQGDRVLLVSERGPVGEVINVGGSRIYVSPGHGVSLVSAASLVRGMLRRHRLPEPVRVADSISKRVKGEA